MIYWEKNSFCFLLGLFNLSNSFNWLLLLLFSLSSYWLFISLDDDNFWILNLKLIVNHIVQSWCINVSDPFDSIAVFPFSISLDAIFVSKVSKSMLLFVLPATIINSSIFPGFDTKTMLFVIMKFSDVFVSVSVNASSMALSHTFDPITSVCVLAFSHFSALAMLNPFAVWHVVFLLTCWTLSWIFNGKHDIQGISMVKSTICQFFWLIGLYEPCFSITCNKLFPVDLIRCFKVLNLFASF